MKKLITQKQLIEQGFEKFKFAGEYLFVGKAEIYIDRGDDDIIKFHDGKRFIRFICSQRDLTFFYKINKDAGDSFDMLRISDYNEFNIRVISERFSFKEDELLNLLTQIRDNALQCCEVTNNNLKVIKTKIGSILSKLDECCKEKEQKPDPEPEPDPEPIPEEPEEPLARFKPNLVFNYLDTVHEEMEYASISYLLLSVKNLKNNNKLFSVPDAKLLLYEDRNDEKGFVDYGNGSLLSLLEPTSSGTVIPYEITSELLDPYQCMQFKVKIVDSDGNDLSELSNSVTVVMKDAEPTEPNFEWYFDDIEQPNDEEVYARLFGRKGKEVTIKVDALHVGNTVTTIQIDDYQRTIKGFDESFSHSFVMPADVVEVSMIISTKVGNTVNSDVKMYIDDYQGGSLVVDKAIIGVNSIAQDDAM